MGIVALMLALTVGGAVIAIDHYGSVDRAQTADVIIVLGAQVSPGGQPGPALTRRARHAAALYLRGLAPVVLCSGGVGANPPSEARAACDLVASLGIPPEVIFLEEEARSTEENALNSAAIMRQHRWRTAIVVTDGYHLYRGALMFERAGVMAYPSPAQVTTGPMDSFERYSREVREAAAVAWYWLKTALRVHVTHLKF